MVLRILHHSFYLIQNKASLTRKWHKLHLCWNDNSPFLEFWFAKSPINLANFNITPFLGPVLCSCPQQCLFCCFVRAPWFTTLIFSRGLTHNPSPFPLCFSSLSLTLSLNKSSSVSMTNLCLALTWNGHCLSPTSQIPSVFWGSTQIMPPPRTETFFFKPHFGRARSTRVCFVHQ